MFQNVCNLKDHAAERCECSKGYHKECVKNKEEGEAFIHEGPWSH